MAFSGPVLPSLGDQSMQGLGGFFVAVAGPLLAATDRAAESWRLFLAYVWPTNRNPLSYWLLPAKLLAATSRTAET